MTHLSRAGLLSLVALTLHYSVLSIMLHVSRSSPGARYHASSAIALTEFFKILVAITLVLWSGELRPAVSERRRLYWENEERKAVAEANEPAWLGEEKRGSISDASGSEDGNLSSNGADDQHHDWMSMAEVDSSLLQPKRSTPNTLRIDSALAQNQAKTTPQLAFIPATPAPEPSPARPLDANGLYPTRPSFDLRATGSHSSDLIDFEWWKTLRDAVWSDDWWKLAFVAALYTVQGNLQYVASGNLSVPLFQLAYQLKIPATAMCSVMLLKRVLSQQQWASLFVLTLGVGIVQIYSVAARPSEVAPSTLLASTHESTTPSQLLGLTSVMAACISSGFASCFFEQILKAPQINTKPITSPPTPSLPKPSIWIRNIQLSIFGLVAGLPVVLWEMRSCASGLDFPGMDLGWFQSSAWFASVATTTFFDGFNAITWIVIFLQVTGGLLGALVMKHADNLLKCFSTSMSILLSVIASVFLFDFRVNLGIIFGASLVVLSTYVYMNPTSSGRWRPVSPSPRRHHTGASPSISINGVTSNSSPNLS